MNIDMSKTIEPKSDQLNSDSLIAGPKTITVTRVSGNPESKEQPVSFWYEGDEGRPWKPCLSMRRAIISLWGRFTEDYIGKSITLYRDPSVKWGGMEVGGIRISHMSHIDAPITLALTATRGNKKPFTVKPLVVEKSPEFADHSTYRKELWSVLEGGDELKIAAFWSETDDQRAAFDPKTVEKMQAVVNQKLAGVK